MRARVLATVVLAAAGFTLAACAATPTSTPTAGGSTTQAAPPTTVGAHHVSAGDADNGHTITIAVGDQLQVTLHSTYWHFDPATSGTALRAAGEPNTTASPTGPSNSRCVPGEGCGTVTAMYDAAAPGTADVTASRTSCGEARGCTGNQGSYRLTVVIK